MTPTPTQFAMLLRLSRGPVRQHELAYPTLSACEKRGWVKKSGGYMELTDDGREAMKAVKS